MDFANINLPEVLFFLSYGLYALAYIVTSMFWLRLITIIAATLSLPYFYFQPTPLWSAIGWQMVFASINIVNLLILAYAILSSRLTAFESTVHRQFFPKLKPHEVKPLIKLAVQQQIHKNQTILTEGADNDGVYLLVEGELIVEKQNELLGKLQAGSLVGEMSYISGEPVSADVIAVAPTVLLVWDKQALDKLYAKSQMYRGMLMEMCTRDLVHKLNCSNDSVLLEINSKATNDCVAHAV